MRTRLGILAVAIFLAGCADNAPSDTPSYTPPAWFSQQVQQREAHAAALQGCMDRKGWDVTVTEEGGVEEHFSDMAEFNAMMADMIACRGELGLPTGDPPPLTESQAREMYQHAVETWECLRNEGFALAAPPSEDAFVEQILNLGQDGDYGGLWLPWADPALPLREMTDAQYEELGRTCPQFNPTL